MRAGRQTRARATLEGMHTAIAEVARWLAQCDADADADADAKCNALECSLSRVRTRHVCETREADRLGWRNAMEEEAEDPMLHVGVVAPPRRRPSRASEAGWDAGQKESGGEQLCVDASM